MRMFFLTLLAALACAAAAYTDLSARCRCDRAARRETRHAHRAAKRGFTYEAQPAATPTTWNPYPNQVQPVGATAPEPAAWYCRGGRCYPVQRNPRPAPTAAPRPTPTPDPNIQPAAAETQPPDFTPPQTPPAVITQPAASTAPDPVIPPGEPRDTRPPADPPATSATQPPAADNRRAWFPERPAPLPREFEPDRPEPTTSHI